MTNLKQWPPPLVEKKQVVGIYPIDFVFEAFLEEGLKWFRETPGAANVVYGHLLDERLKGKYGQAKIDEIRDYIIETEIDVKQAWPIEDEESPSISINIQNQQEKIERAGLSDHANQIVGFDTIGNVTSVQDRAYIPMMSDVLIGIHATGSPDKTKYLYYLVVYILQAFKSQLDDRDDAANGLFNLTFRASDISRLNEYLPQYMFSRFVTVSVEHFDLIEKDAQPLVKEFEVNVDVEGGQ